MIVHTDGTGLRSLLPDVDGSVPSWAPSGERIAFTLVTHGTTTTSVDIATVRPDGSGLRVLTDSSDGVDSFAPDYAPHGSRLVFSRGTPDGCPLVITHSSGHGARVLTPAASGCYVDASWGGAKTTKDQ
jgi:Tol biopolymer transport system component